MYVHELPPSIAADARKWQTAMYKQDPNYKAEWRFYSRLLNDWSLRTDRPDAAKLFYVPMWSIGAVGNTAYKHNLIHFDRIIRALLEHRFSPLNGSKIFATQWKRNQSATVVFFGGDKGACLLPPGPIYMHHWGLQTDWAHMLDPDSYTPPKDPSDPASRYDRRCSSPSDVIVPPGVRLRRPPDPPTQDAANSSGLLPLDAPASSYDCDLFFAGSITKRPGTVCMQHNGSSAPCYSQGVRAAIFAHHFNRTSRFCLAERLPREAHDKLLRRSRFCLCANGEGFGIRLSLALSWGCVPLLIQPKVRQPLDDLLPYDSFSLRLGLEDIPTLHEALDRVTVAEHAKLRIAGARYVDAFNWADEHGGKAYEWVRYSLCLRAGVECEHLRPG